MTDEIVFEVPHQFRQGPRRRFVGAAAEEHPFRPEHLRDLRQQRGAPHGHQAVGHPTHQRIGGDAGQPVGAAAFQTNDQLAGSDLLPRISGGPVDERAQQGFALPLLVLRGLAFQKRRALRVPAAQQVPEYGDPAVFTPQPQHQHAPRVGVADQAAEDPPGIRLVVPHLGTAVGMGPGVYAVHPPPGIGLHRPRQGLGHTVDTAHRGDDPNLVPDPHPSVAAPVAPEGPDRHRLQGQGGHLRPRSLVLVQRGAQVMAVHPRPGGDIPLGPPDGAAVFDHLAPGGDGGER